MTALDNQLVGLIAELSVDGEARPTASELATALDCSENSVLRAIRRLTQTGQIEVIHSPGRAAVLRVPGGDERAHERAQPQPPPP